MHADDRIPIRDIPKAILDVYVLIFHEPPTEAQLITHSPIAGWIIEQGNEDLVSTFNEFWAARRKYGAERVALHVHHDVTRRSDRKVGKQGELMQSLASYFHPGRGHAVSFILSMRFTVGGSAAHTARALVIALSDMGI